MRRDKVLLLVSSLAALGLLAIAAAEENLWRDWRRVQRAASAPDGELEVRLRQIVVPALGVADRCVSCHVGMQAGEPSVAGDPALAPHSDVGHDVNAFGCTVCHGGQGRATEIEDAHGRVPFWPEPLIPLEHADAGCGSCHTHLAVASSRRLERGRSLVERHDCLACHALDGRGGTLRPGGGVVQAPDLSRAGARDLAAGWYDAHLAQHQKATEGPWKSDFGPLDGADLEEIEAYLATRVGAPELMEGKSLFHALGCRGCHKVGGVGGDDGPDLTRAGERDPGRTDFSAVRGERTLAHWFAEHFRAPARVVPGSQMPALDLSEAEIDQLTHYMFSLRRSDLPEAFWPKDRMRAERFGQREFATDGETLFGVFCAACHGRSGEGVRYGSQQPFPAVANPDFLALASDEFLSNTLQHGRPGRRMPAWGDKDGGLRPEEIRAVVAELRVLGGGVAFEGDAQPPRWAAGDAREGERLYGLHCASCHGAEGQGGEGVALANRVLLESATDTYLTESIRRGRRGTTMPGFSAPGPARQALSDGEIESIVTFLRSWESVQ
jgi:mono/diheme cytochrome c family protein